MWPVRVVAYSRVSGPIATLANDWPIAVERPTFSNEIDGSPLPVLEPVVNVAVYGKNAWPDVSCNPEVMAKVYFVLAASGDIGWSTSASPAADVLSVAPTSCPSLVRYSFTLRDVSVLGLMTAPGLGSKTWAAMNASGLALAAPLPGRVAVMSGRKRPGPPRFTSKRTKETVTGPSLFLC